MPACEDAGGRRAKITRFGGRTPSSIRIDRVCDGTALSESAWKTAALPLTRRPAVCHGQQPMSVEAGDGDRRGRRRWLTSIGSVPSGRGADLSPAPHTARPLVGKIRSISSCALAGWPYGSCPVSSGKSINPLLEHDPAMRFAPSSVPRQSIGRGRPTRVAEVIAAPAPDGGRPRLAAGMGTLVRVSWPVALVRLRHAVRFEHLSHVRASANDETTECSHRILSGR